MNRIEKTLHYARELLVIGMAAAVITLVFFALPVLKHAAQIEADADTAVKDAQRRLDDTSQNVNAALIQIGLTADEARRASIEQRKYWADVSKETIAAVRHADELIQATTANVNKVGAGLEGVTIQAQKPLGALTLAIGHLNTVTQHLDENLAGNKDLTRAIAGLADSAEQVKAATANVAATTNDIRERVHTLTHPKPQKWFIAAGEKLLDWAYKLKSLI